MTAKVIRIPNNWRPRAVWRYLERGGKRAICIWHRRAGKDDVCLHGVMARVSRNPTLSSDAGARLSAGPVPRSGQTAKSG